MQSDTDRHFVPPAWLNDSFLKQIISAARKDPSVSLCHSCKLHPGSKPGKNYASVLYRTTVHFRSARSHQEQAINLMLKTEKHSTVLRDRSLFETEIHMYREVLPAMENLLKNIGVSLNTPRFFYTSDHPHGLIVLEDLFPSGWFEKEQILEFENVQPVIQSIARFHAASWILNETLTNISNPIMEKNISGLGQLFCTLFNLFIDSVSSWEEYRSLGAKLRTLKDQFVHRMKQIYRPSSVSTAYNVLNHGDFHARNLLHKIETLDNGLERVQQTALIDFQLCHWGSPAIDLLYLLDLIIDRDLKHSRRDRIIREYHDSFVHYLERLGHRGWTPSLRDLLAELNRHAFLELVHVAVFEQIRHANMSKGSWDDFLTGRLEDAGFNNAKYRALVRKDLPDFLRRGVLE
ncbi:uncharacterized protein LOC128744380 isoform X2 [Sabethes cyaneus]|uniref:uncharacterized protein LOC128744380 isoform X2 n=1 Tax=Sabethes cyaneus TaxID=53552 RepID=UPI00237E688C|nr:uncharacterized protein LOC128744380 isoform X2 [Sabethes cyaneus]